MIVKAPGWKGTGLGRCRGLGCVKRGLGQSELIVDPTTGEGFTISQLQNILGNAPGEALQSVLSPFQGSSGSSLSTSDLMNALAALPGNQLSTVLAPFQYGSTSISSGTLLLIGGAAIFFVVLMAAKK